jgi:hypothetical protein
MNTIDILPDDIMSLILKIRGDEMKKDKQTKDNKLKFQKVLNELRIYDGLTFEFALETYQPADYPERDFYIMRNGVMTICHRYDFPWATTLLHCIKATQ